MTIRPVQFLGDRLRLLDQTRLPLEEAYIEVRDAAEVVEAIRSMRVRGAPAIGVAAAYGLALAAQRLPSGQGAADDLPAFRAALLEVAALIGNARPTAVNLRWAVDRLLRRAERCTTVAEAKAALLDEASRIDAENDEAHRRIALHGAALLPDGARVLTHCNTGPLATAAAYGTALGAIQAAWEQGKRLHVFADETRPLLQGARLTAWELARLGIPCTLLADSAAGFSLARRQVDCIIVGADRIAANGDTANKIGTYTLAVLAKEHHVPFYVAAPISTIDLSLASGEGIPIEERDPAEVRSVHGLPIAPDEVAAFNPAFDVTPHRLITAIITERGVVWGPDFQHGLKALCSEELSAP